MSDSIGPLPAACGSDRRPQVAQYARDIAAILVVALLAAILFAALLILL